MRRIGRDTGQRRPPQVVEAVNEVGIGGERFGRADILDPVPLPQPAGTTKGGDSGLGGDARAGEDDDVADGVHGGEDRMCLGRLEWWSGRFGG